MGPFFLLLFVINCFGKSNGAQYYGKLIGKLSELHHGVSGEVYAVDGRTLYIKDFTYDGQGPAAYFYAGHSRTASSSGFRLRDENGSPQVLRRYRKEGATITLPEGKNLNNIKIFYVWCEEFEVNFGDVKIPRNFDYPRPQKIDILKGVHAISSDNIVIVDAQTLLIPNLSYDGEAPDAKFWVGRGPKPSPQGIRVPDENGKEVPLRRYDRKTVVLTLPGDLTVFDIGHFGIWCEAFTVDFGHIQIPSNLNVPPSLKMLGISPQSKLNCEVLYDDLAFEVRWAIAGDSIVLQLVAKLADGEYMAFGLSGDEKKNKMIGGDVVVAWIDKITSKGYAQDYYLSAKSQCSGPSGSCPDDRFQDNSDNVRLLNAATVNGYSIITYQRPLKSSDKYDIGIQTNKSQAIIWAIGPLNERNEVSFHTYYTKHNHLFNFGRTPKWNCPMPENDHPIESTPRSREPERRRGTTRNDSDKSSIRKQPARSAFKQRTTTVSSVPTPSPVSQRNAWEIPPIQCYEPEDGVFYAQMGPTGGKKGYPAITGHVGWGISWYINGLLIPEINVIRGKTYTFVVEGGFNPDIPAKYHPFYITDDPIGGYEHKTDEEKKRVRIFAGAEFNKDGSVTPTGTGRLCHWTQTGDIDADDFESFGAYQRTLELKCDQGEPGVIQWTPDKNTPDTVYYECFTHRYLGWKINVHDHCGSQGSASEINEEIVNAPIKDDDLEESPSIQIETRVNSNQLIGIEEDKDKSNISDKPLNFIYGQLEHHHGHQQHNQKQQSKQRLQKFYLNQKPFFFKTSFEYPDYLSSKQKLLFIIPSSKLERPFQIQNNIASVRSNNTTVLFLPKKINQNSNLNYKPMFFGPVSSSNKSLIQIQPIFLKNINPKIRIPMITKPSIPRNNEFSKTNFIHKPLINFKNDVKLLNVEISPQQASTEKEPIIKHNIKKITNETGFRSESLIIKGGFKPIIKDFSKITFLDELKIQPESEVGIIHKRNLNKSEITKDKFAKADETVDAYYLPSLESINKKLDSIISPATVVTYDGKIISGGSLTAKFTDTNNRKSELSFRNLKPTDLIKTGPQFVLFRGELPPLTSQISESNKQLQVKRVINKDLDISPLTKTTLKLIRNKRASHDIVE